MKKIAFALFVVLIAVACSKTSPKKVENTITEGTWKVSLFSEDGVDETFYFNGITFKFNSDNTVTATGNGTTVNGTWKVEKDSFDDDDSNHTHFTLNFPVVGEFDELNDDWHVISLNDDRIELEDVSGDGSIDKLTFTKN